MSMFRTYEQISTEKEMKVKLKTLSLLKKLDIRTIELSIINFWLHDNYEDEIGKYATSIPIPKKEEGNSDIVSPPEQIWRKSSEAASLFKLSKRDLLALRKNGDFIEGIHYVRQKSGGKYGNISYDLKACSRKLYQVSYAELTHPKFDLNKHKAKLLEASFDQVAQNPKPRRQLFAVGGKK